VFIKVGFVWKPFHAGERDPKAKKIIHSSMIQGVMNNFFIGFCLEFGWQNMRQFFTAITIWWTTFSFRKIVTHFAEKQKAGVGERG